MKTVSFTISLILICYIGYGQSNPFPIGQNIGGPATAVKTPSYGAFYGGIIPYTFADTTAANTALTYGKTYNGFTIYTQSPQATWWRLADSSKWVMILPQGGGTPVSGQAWINPGNYSLFTDAKLNGAFGTLQANGIYIKTNGITRAYLDRYGIAPETGTTVGLGIDPSDSNRITYFSGSGSTPTWQQTLTAGSTLSTAAVIDMDGNEFTWSNSAGMKMQGAYLSVNATGSPISIVDSSFNAEQGIRIVRGVRFDGMLNATTQDRLIGQTSSSGTLGYITLSGLTLSSGVLTNPNPTPGANTALSNLASVAINTTLLPGTTNSIALGSTAKIWSDVQSDYFHSGGLNATYAGYSGAILGGTANHAILDFFDANVRIGEFYTTSSSFNFFTGTGKALNFYTNNSTSIPLLTGSGTSAQLGVNMTTPAAQLHISAGSTAAGSAPLKFTAGTNMTAAEAGAMEWDGTNLFITQTTGPTRKTIAYTSDLTGLPYIALTGTSNATGNIELSMNSGPYDFSISEANTITLDASVGTKTLYFKSQAISSASVGDALTVVNTTTGEIGTAPNLAFNFQKEKTMIYAKNGRLFAEDATGNLTAISPHWFTEEFKPSEEMAWSFYSRNEKIGKEIFIDMLLLARKVEEWTGEKLVYIKDIPKK